MPGLGRQIVERAFERAGKTFRDEKLKAALPRLARASASTTCWPRSGAARCSPATCVKAVYPDFKDERKPADGQPPSASTAGSACSRAASLQFKLPRRAVPTPHAIPIRGLDGDLPVRFAPNGGAVPGDRIVGILTPGEGITIYPIQSPALADFEDEPERWLDVRWDLDDRERAALSGPHRAAPRSTSRARWPRSPRSIAEHDGNIDNVSMVRPHAGLHRDEHRHLTVWDLKHLNAIIGELQAKPVVNEVERVTG